jgi:Fe2+ or Zn2+ uptake regulation protein
MFSTQAVCERLHREGKKVTPQRRLIYQALEGTTTHPRAEDLYEQVRSIIPDISLATIYKTLRELVQMGELLEIRFTGDQARFDPRIEPHHHLSCTKCGWLEDVVGSFPQIVDGLEKRDFQILQTEVVFWGLCAECQTSTLPVLSNNLA